MPQPREMYWLNGQRVRELRKALRFSQVELESKSLALDANVSRRTLQDIEHNIRPVSQETLERLAKVLEVPTKNLVVQAIVASAVAGWGSSEGHPRDAWIRTPKLSHDQSRKLAHAVRCAMAERPDQAARICRQVLRRIEKAGAFEDYGAVLIKLVTFLDEAGRHQEAFEELKRFFSDIDAGRACSESCRSWAEYHKGICIRRLAEKDADLYPAAEKVFVRLELLGGKLGPASTHQLGVVYLEQAARRKDKNSTNLLIAAEQSFLKARQVWQRTGRSFREAYPLRRLGQLCALQGRFADALEYFLDALTIFIRHHADRYVHETRKDIKQFISTVAFKRSINKL